MVNISPLNIFKAGMLITLTSICLTLINGYAFLHVHVTDDGRIIAHSHPIHDRSANKNGPVKHSHSNLEFCSYQNVNHFEKFLLPSNIKNFCTFKAFYLDESRNDIIIRFSLSHDYSLRAPPNAMHS